jgi:hypothetical protein
LIQDLIHLQEDISGSERDTFPNQAAYTRWRLLVNGSIQAILRTLQEQDPRNDRYSIRSESSEPSIETVMCDVDTVTDGAVRIEARIEAEPSPEVVEARRRRMLLRRWIHPETTVAHRQ